MDNNTRSANDTWIAEFLRHGSEDMMSWIRHFDRLQTMKDQLEAKLDLDDAGLSVGMGYRARRDLRDRISEISEEIFALEQRARCFQN